jgi:hypothetical protein
MNPIDNKNLEEILHRLIVDIANDKEVLYRMTTKESFADAVVAMQHLFIFKPKKESSNVR